MRAEVLSVNYAVSLEGQPCDVSDLDWSGFLRDKNGFRPDDILNEVDGIRAIEYTGLLGNYVFFTAESDEARDEFLRVLADLLPRVVPEIERIEAEDNEEVEDEDAR